MPDWRSDLVNRYSVFVMWEGKERAFLGGLRDETMRINSREERREGGAERRKKQERRSILDILDNVNLYT